MTISNETQKQKLEEEDITPAQLVFYTRRLLDYLDGVADMIDNNAVRGRLSGMRKTLKQFERSEERRAEKD